mmetsp:Transcript_81121/g.251758  ORF Transcript_81121/g.251758 Transcript_81121/m.251758 type:complete len:463 (+) Transcript_81121:48-1436(+)
MSVADVDWEAVAAKLPYDRTSEAYAKRNEMFDLFDPNGNGYLSLAEIDKGVRDVLQLDDMFNAKPAIMRAFQASKNYLPADSGTPGEDYVQRREFRIFLQFLRHYFELWVMFEGIDSEMDRRINLEEFTAAIPLLAKWGVLIEEGTQESVFNQIDSNDGGQVLFAEFCDWAIKQKLDLGEEKDDGDCPELGMTVEEKIKNTFSQYDTDDNGVISAEELTSVLSTLNPNLQAMEIDQILASADCNRDGVVDYKEFVDWLFKRRGGREGKNTEAMRKMIAAEDVDWEAISAKLPFERTKEAFQKRSELFNQFDPNGNGYLSLAEVDKGIRDVLQVDAIFDAKPAIMRAFQASKQACPSPEGSPGDDYVQRKEFRILLQFLRHYFELWVMFKTIDSEGDRRINLEEFTEAVPLLKDWGLEMEEGAEAGIFDQIDSNDGGQVLFVEFCSWAIKQKLDLGEEEEPDE